MWGFILAAVVLVVIGVIVYFIYFNRAAGEACSYDAQCKNGACGRPTAADGAATVCCASGATAGYAGYDYCTKMPSNAVCWSDAQCATGYCSSNAGGTMKGYCAGDFAAGAVCHWDNDCANKACGRPTAADDAEQVCCPSGESESYGGFGYCTQMKSGSVCWSDAQCAGGYCKGNAGGLQKGVCSGDAAAGAACDADGECANKACARQTADDGAVTTCCPSGKSALYAGYDYCLGMPSGSTCWSDAQCASDYCGGNMGGIQRGKCR